MNADQSDWFLKHPDITIPTAGLRDNEGRLDPVALAEIAFWAADELAPSMPAFDDAGNPVQPPDSHILDYLARAWSLTDEYTEQQHPIAASTVCVWSGELPTCNPCKSPARYDAPTLTVHGSVWSYLCVEHARNEQTTIGAGKGTYLMRKDEVPAAIRLRVDRRLAQLGRETLFGSNPEVPDSQH